MIKNRRLLINKNGINFALVNDCRICATWETSIPENTGAVWAVFLSTTLHTASGTGIIPMTIPKAHAQEERQLVLSFTREAPDRI